MTASCVQLSSHIAADPLHAWSNSGSVFLHRGRAGVAYFHLIVNRGVSAAEVVVHFQGIPRLLCGRALSAPAAGTWVWECEMQWNEIGHLALPAVTRQKYASVFARAEHGRHTHTLKPAPGLWPAHWAISWLLSCRAKKKVKQWNACEERKWMAE